MMAEDLNGFIATYGPFAAQIAKQTGQDPATVLGLLAHETSFGTHIAGNNIFGISPGGKDIVAPYPNIEAAGQAYVNLMKQPRYQGVAAAKGPDAQAIALQLSGYNSKVPNYGVQVSDKIRQLQTAGYDPNAPTLDDAMKLRRSMSPAAPSQAPADQGNAPSLDDAMKLRRAMPQLVVPDTPSVAGSPGAQTGTATQVGAAPPPSFIERSVSYIPEGVKNFAVGAAQGVKSIIDPQAEFLARNLGDNALTRAIGLPSSQDVTAADLANTQAYNQQYGNSGYARVGNLLGQGVAIGAETAPISMVGGSLAGALRAPQYIATAPAMVTNASGAAGAASPLVSVAMPNAARAVNLLTGAAQGAAGAGLERGNVGVGALAGGAAVPVGAAMRYFAQNRLMNKLLENQYTRAATKLVAGGAGLQLGTIEALLAYGHGADLNATIANLLNTALRAGGNVNPALVGAVAGRQAAQAQAAP